jgi:RimJ/RimL family protein N-acetyltransferase
MSSRPVSQKIPIVETERLILRGHRPDDFENCVALWADPVVTRYIGGKPFSAEEVWARLLRYVGHWTLLGFGFWAIEDKAAGSFVGELGFADFKRSIDPPLDMPELGWVLASNAHGKGYATEAVRAAIGWGEQHFGPIQTTCIIDPENHPSLRVAEKCGYRETRRAIYKGQPMIVFTR